MAERRDRESLVLDLVGSVYDAALDGKLWTRLAEKIARTFGAMSLGLILQAGDAAEFLSRTENLSGWGDTAYERHYHRHDVWAQRAARLGLSKVLASKDLIADSEFDRTEFCNDYCRPLDVYYVVGALIPVTADQTGILALHRPRRGGHFGDEDKGLVATFLPHLQRALQIRHQLGEAATERQAALNALERSGTAVLVVTGTGKILYANREAEELLRTGDGLRMIGGRVAAADHFLGQRLAALIHQSADTAAGKDRGAGGAISIPRPERLPLAVLAAPFRPARDGFGPPVPAAILFIRDPEARTPALLAVRGLFGLTGAEARIASALASGISLEKAAVTLGISLHTARTQLKSAFAKTGTSRQAELVALILRSVGGFG